MPAILALVARPYYVARQYGGIMMHDSTCSCTRGILLGDYFKAVVTGQKLPADKDREAHGSPFCRKYDPGQLTWVRDPNRLAGTDMTNAFNPE